MVVLAAGWFHSSCKKNKKRKCSFSIVNISPDCSASSVLVNVSVLGIQAVERETPDDLFSFLRSM